MKTTLKKGDKIIVVEGAQLGEKGIITNIQRVYVQEDRVTRWMVWADGIEGGDRIKTRLSWVREL